MAQFESPQREHARAAGWMLIAMTFTGIGAEFLARMGLFVPGDLTATVSNMQNAPWKYNIGLLCYVATFFLDILVAVHFYRLFEIQNRTRSLLAMSFRLVYTGIVISFLMLYVVAGLFLYTDLLSQLQMVENLYQQVYMMMHLFGEGFLFALIFFGFHLIYLGLLVAASGVLPKWLGILLLLGGLSYSLNGLLHFMLPTVQQMLAPLFGLLGMAEVILAVFLVIKSGKNKEANA